MAEAPENGATDLARLCDEVEGNVDRLRVLYDQFLVGIEKLPPVRLHDATRAMVRRLTVAPTNNTQQRFRARSLVARFGTFDHRWSKILRDFEEDSLPRQRLASASRTPVEEPAQARRGHAPGTPAAPRGPEPPRLAEIFRSYVQAKEQCGEATDKLTLDLLNKAINREVARAGEKNGWSSVDFQVVIRQGRPALKAVPGK